MNAAVAQANPLHGLNLDFKCAKAGRDMAAALGDKGKKVLPAAAQLLSRRGAYSAFLYLEIEGPAAATPLIELLQSQGFLSDAQPQPANEKSYDRIKRSFEDDLPKLLCARELLKRALDYAHAHSKLAQPAGG